MLREETATCLIQKAANNRVSSCLFTVSRQFCVGWSRPAIVRFKERPEAVKVVRQTPSLKPIKWIYWLCEGGHSVFPP